MQDYPLEELGPRAFEQLTVALALKVLGPGVEAFGSGPDGGREATYDGPVSWSATTGLGTDSWNGYVVIQAKQRENPEGPKSNALWLKKQIIDELDRWMNEESKRLRFPRYIIFMTNVRLSSVAATGGIDQLEADIWKKIRGNAQGVDTPYSRGLRGWKIWHRDQINGMLTTYNGVRQAFPGMLTAGDVLSRIRQLPGALNLEDLHPVLTTHARTTLTNERWVNFSEAGGSARQSVENVIIDLNIEGDRGYRNTILKEVFALGDTIQKSSMSNGAPRHIVITGQPGNGKSTISRFIVQVYRSVFMSEEGLGRISAADVRQGTFNALERVGIDPPKNRRWPFRVNLADFADDLGPSSDKSLMRWLSEKVSLRAEIDLKPIALKKWLRNWPWLLILDGLDEVTSPEVRRRILDEIQNFMDDADVEDADLLMVITTRPTGYTERFAPDHFSQLDLQYLDFDSAVEYGRLVTTLRLSDDLDRRDQILSKFEKHAADSTMVRLMKTPLQVLIMTFILERLGNLPGDRYQLFWRYYETVYDRESAKNTQLASLFAQYRSAITELHETVGLTLQTYAETSTDARALLPLEELRELAKSRLLEIGHDENIGASRLADKIVTAATRRLVLLSPSEDDTVSFEIRSLQELMAARALSNGTDDAIRQRLRLTAPSPHWRNTWVFTAGRLFAEGPDHRRDLVTEIVENVDRDTSWPGWLCPVGPELAADLIDDGLATSTPKWQRRIVDVALRVLDGYVPRDIAGMARALSIAAQSTTNNLIHIRGSLKKAVAGTPISAFVARAIIDRGDFGAPIFIKYENANPKENVAQVDIIPLLQVLLGEIQGDPHDIALVQSALDELAEIRDLREFDPNRKVYTFPSLLPLTVEAVHSANASLMLSLIFNDLDVSLWRARDLLAAAIWPQLSRVEVGRVLRNL
ncbi:hypothetical protein EDD29_7270 [Actinocorallia herbida]|uniref:NACHT domain-containing protein n=1 Tax=Actinocorallia herbida TaxID=58109 RepID=A0A3N1D7V5_9ACTN|nr:hypothetical protein [Actinocorallia herbida]ROO89571.1 hypothetical protein EDD29_7270 [Actinocorallia herbida]